MNFRGSTGYGVAFERAGRKQWGDAMVNDVSDGTRWLLKRGLADQERICIVGASFGGYATLMGAVHEPTLYKCGVSLNGVADLPLFLDRYENFIGGHFSSRYIGQLWEDKASLRRSSPINSVRSIEAPLMIVASESDLVVPPRQSRRMYNALKKSNKPVEFIELPQGDHFLSREENRQSFAHALLRFLDEHLGKPQQQLAQAISSSQ